MLWLVFISCYKRAQKGDISRQINFSWDIIPIYSIFRKIELFLGRHVNEINVNYYLLMWIFIPTLAICSSLMEFSLANFDISDFIFKIIFWWLAYLVQTCKLYQYIKWNLVFSYLMHTTSSSPHCGDIQVILDL